MKDQPAMLQAAGCDAGKKWRNPHRLFFWHASQYYSIPTEKSLL